MGDKCPNCDQYTLVQEKNGEYTCTNCKYSEKR